MIDLNGVPMHAAPLTSPRILCMDVCIGSALGGGVCVEEWGGRDTAPDPSSAELHEAVEEEVHPLYAHEVGHLSGAFPWILNIS